MYSSELGTFVSCMNNIMAEGIGCSIAKLVSSSRYRFVFLSLHLLRICVIITFRYGWCQPDPLTPYSGADPRMVRIDTGPPPFWQINHANSAYFMLFWGYFRVISATQPQFWISPPLLHILDPPLIFKKTTQVFLKIQNDHIFRSTLRTFGLISILVFFKNTTLFLTFQGHFENYPYFWHFKDEIKKHVRSEFSTQCTLIKMRLHQGNFKGEHVVAAILPSRVEVSYWTCFCGFFFFSYGCQAISLSVCSLSCVDLNN